METWKAVLLTCALVIPIPGLFLWRFLRQQRRRARPVLEHAAATLGGSIDLGKRVVAGRLDDIPTRLRLCFSAGASDEHGVTIPSRWYSEICCPLPKGVAQSMLLRLRIAEEGDLRLARDGMLVDLTLGDASFDRRYVVEGAPEELVRGLLDEQTRAAMAEFQLGLDIPDAASDGELRLTIEEWPQGDRLSRALRLASHLAQRTGEILADAEQAIARGAQAQGRIPETVVRLARAERERDIAELAALLRRRRARTIALVVIVLVLAFGAAAAMAAFGR